MSGAGQIIGTIAGTTVGVAAIGAIETGNALYHTGAAAAGVISNYFSEGGEEIPSSAGSTPEPKAKGRPRKIKEIFKPSPEAEHEPKGSSGRPRSESRRRNDLLPARKDEDKPARKTRSGKDY